MEPVADRTKPGQPRVDIVSSALVAALGESTAPTHSTSFGVMGTTASITLVGGSSDMLAELVTEAHAMDQRWSRFRPDSEVSQLNWAEGQAVEVSPDTAVLIQGMRAAHAVTRGVYDPTILPALVAGGYAISRVDASRVTTLPESARWPGNIDGAIVSGNTVTLPRGTTVDPGGIGKGYAADLLVAAALDAGALGVLVEMGGDLRIAGEAPDGHQWRIGIENPFVPTEHIKIVNLVDGAVATSSRLKKTWTINGENHHHLVDARSGTSLITNVVTVTVIAATATRAEVLTKPGFVWPIDEYLDWLPTVGAAGIVIDSTGTCTESDNWSDYE